jgi:mannose-6-phosphate isomerase
MSTPPIPVRFQPLFKTKPWGGRRLATLLDKSLPPGDPIGESWEIVSLPQNESTVAGGPLDGQPLAALVDRWGDDLLGGAPRFDGRFPLLIKFLDASEHLSVQVHPKPDAGDPAGWQPGIKHECWYVLHAEPDAKLFIGLKPGVGPEDVRRVANTPEMADILRVWDGHPGMCFYLPSGTLHALGAGLLVAEVQTPSDVTYRAYDWDRVGLDGKPRDLHIEQTLANVRYDVSEEMILQPRSQVVGPLGTSTRVAACERFEMDVVKLEPAGVRPAPTGRMRIWMVLEGRGRLTRGGHDCAFSRGDVVLIPAAGEGMTFELDKPGVWIDVTIPTPA